MADFLLPDLGEGLAEAAIVAWHVAIGDVVTVDQPVVEVETAKAVVEVPVPFAGRVVELFGSPGDVVEVGRPLMSVEVSNQGDGSGSVLVGYGTSDGRRRRRHPAPVVSDSSVPPATDKDGPRVKVVSPLVRRMAREAGLDLTTLAGTGTGGLITRRDVDQAMLNASSQILASDSSIRIPIHGARKVAAEKFIRSRREIPEATIWVDVDATESVRLRQHLNTGAPSICLLALLSRFAVLGLARFRELNARIEGDEIVVQPSVNLGFAAQTGRGLIVPVIPGVHMLTLDQLAMALADRVRRADEGTLAPADLGGGTFTANNYGVFGVDGSTPIINHPEVAILGMGRIIERPWVVAGRLEVRMVTQLTLAFDHRACDGATAGRFLRFVADCIEQPASVLRYL